MLQFFSFAEYGYHLENFTIQRQASYFSIPNNIDDLFLKQKMLMQVLSDSCMTINYGFNFEHFSGT